MNQARLAAGFLIVALAGSFSSAAGSSQRLDVGSNATLVGASLPAGTYKVSWKSHSPEVMVTFTSLQGGKVIAKAEGKLSKRTRANPYSAVVYSIRPDGSRAVIELQFAGMKQVIVFPEPAAATNASSTQGEAGTAPQALASGPKRVTVVQFIGKPRAKPLDQRQVPLWPPSLFPTMRFQFAQPPASDRVVGRRPRM